VKKHLIFTKKYHNIFFGKIEKFFKKGIDKTPGIWYNIDTEKRKGE